MSDSEKKFDGSMAENSPHYVQFVGEGSYQAQAHNTGDKSKDYTRELCVLGHGDTEVNRDKAWNYMYLGHQHSDANMRDELGNVKQIKVSFIPDRASHGVEGNKLTLAFDIMDRVCTDIHDTVNTEKISDEGNDNMDNLQPKRKRNVVRELMTNMVEIAKCNLDDIGEGASHVSHLMTIADYHANKFRTHLRYFQSLQPVTTADSRKGASVSQSSGQQTIEENPQKSLEDLILYFDNLCTTTEPKHNKESSKKVTLKKEIKQSKKIRDRISFFESKKRDKDNDA